MILYVHTQFLTPTIHSGNTQYEHTTFKTTVDSKYISITKFVIKYIRGSNDFGE